MTGSFPYRSTQAESTLVGCVLVLAFAVYANSLFSGFVMDDHMQIEQNSQLQSFRSLPDIFLTKAWSFHATQYVPNFYRPIPIAGFLLCHKIFGASAVGYHLINILLHVVVVWLVIAVGANLFKDTASALLAGLLFALHPIHTESVSWIAGVMDVELAVFFLTAFLLFLELENARHGKMLWLKAGLYFSFVCALLSKEQAVTLPLVATLYEHLFRDDRFQTSWKQKVERYGGLWALFTAYFVFRLTVLGAIVGKSFHPDITWPQAILTSVALLGRYLEKMVWPAPLSYYYPFQKSSSIRDVNVLVGIAVCVLAATVFMMARKRAWPYSFSILFFILTLSPVLNARWMPGTIFAERYLYLPSAGICWMSGGATLFVWRRWAIQRSALKWVFLPAGLSLALLATHLTWVRNRDWQSDRSLVLRTLAVWPHSAYHRVNLARMLWDDGDRVRAEEELRAALADDPKNPVAWWDLAREMLEEKKYDQAMEFVDRSLAIRSEFAPPFFYRGLIYMQTARPAEAEADFLRAIEISPNATEFRNTLGKFYLEQGRTSEAQQQFEASIHSVPNLEAYSSLAEIYTQGRKTVQAEAMWKNVLKMEPFAVRARFQLGKIYSASGRTEEAKQEYRQGLMLDPRNREAAEALAELDGQSAPLIKH